MVTLLRKECARFVDSSRRATNQVAWNAAGRSNQLEVGMLRNLRACLSRVVTGWFDNVSVLARTEAAGHFKNLSSLLLDYGQLKYSQALLTGHYHIRKP